MYVLAWTMYICMSLALVFALLEGKCSFGCMDTVFITELAREMLSACACRSPRIPRELRPVPMCHIVTALWLSSRY